VTVLHLQGSASAKPSRELDQYRTVPLLWLKVEGVEKNALIATRLAQKRDKGAVIEGYYLERRSRGPRQGLPSS
jgi:hypothetical protein